jgi:hypothetical protein
MNTTVSGSDGRQKNPPHPPITAFRTAKARAPRCGGGVANVSAMATRPALPPDPKRILEIARSDRGAAARALAELSLEQQVAVVCEAPIAHRAELLNLVPFPENVIPQIPEAEFCFTVKAIGLADAPWLLEYATPEQIVACIDLDGWTGLTPDRETLDAWMDALADTSAESFLRSVRTVDPEVVVLYLRNRILVVQKPDEKEGWDPPEGSQTLDGQFYVTARDEDDDLDAIDKMLRGLFEQDYWTYFRMMQGAIWELDSTNEEWAQRWRTGRLEDMGFPPWDEAMNIYRFIEIDERAAIPEGIRPLDVGEWHLPLWLPNLPTTADSRHAIFRAIPLLEDSERRSAFYAFVASANKVAVADQMKLSDAEFAPRAIDKAARFISAGLEHIAAAHRIEAVEVIRRVPMEHLFRVGANLDPERAWS